MGHQTVDGRYKSRMWQTDERTELALPRSVLCR